MPLDAAGTIYGTDTLTTLGIVAVPQHVVQRHKKKVEQEFLDSSRSAAVRLQFGYAQWRTCVLQRSKLSYQLFRPGRLLGGTPMDVSPAPAELIALAEHVNQHAPHDDTFALEYFDTDPILQVINPSGDRTCLGIWDKGKLLHIAQGYRPNLLRRFINRLRY